MVTRSGPYWRDTAAHYAWVARRHAARAVRGGALLSWRLAERIHPAETAPDPEPAGEDDEPHIHATTDPCDLDGCELTGYHFHWRGRTYRSAFDGSLSPAEQAAFDAACARQSERLRSRERHPSSYDGWTAPVVPITPGRALLGEDQTPYVPLSALPPEPPTPRGGIRYGGHGASEGDETL